MNAHILKCIHCGAEMIEDFGALVCSGCGEDQKKCFCDPMDL
jgi:hypothetical protein